MDYDPKEFLLFALDHFGIEVVAQQGHLITLEKGYAIEIEGKNLFKLLQGGQVVAPFADVEALCRFIKMDMPFNEED